MWDGEDMTEKELHKLSRENLLQLLLAQSREVNRQKEEYRQLTEAKEELDAGLERLKAKLDEKDETIERLRAKLDEKDALLDQLRAELDAQPMPADLPAAADNEQVLALEKENDRLQLLFAAQTEELDRLRRDAAKRETELDAQRQSAPEEPNDEWIDLDLVIEEFNEKNQALRELLDAKDAQIAALQGQLTDLPTFMTEIRDELRALRSGQTESDPGAQALLREENERLKAAVAEKEALVRALVARTEPAESAGQNRRPRLWERG